MLLKEQCYLYALIDFNAHSKIYTEMVFHSGFCNDSFQSYKTN